jgi:hypothetical protein
MKSDDETIPVAVVCLALVALLSLAAMVGSVIREREDIILNMPAADIPPQSYMIIDFRFDDSGIVVLDYSVNGNPATAYFPTGAKASAFVDYLKTMGTVEYLEVK